MTKLRGRMRRLVWRLGRTLYCAARGEGANAIERNGEAYVQRCVITGANRNEELVVFDVGGNLGEWTASFIAGVQAQHRTKFRLWAFEPTPETWARLRQRFESTQTVTVENLALSDGEGRATLLLAGETAGTNSLTFSENASAPKIVVTKTTALSFANRHGIERINLLKSDTEGHDMCVLLGALPLLEEERIDVLQFEYNHRWIDGRAFLKDVFERCAKTPYHLYRIRRTHIERLEAWHPELDRFFEANYVLVHDRAKSWFDVLDGTFDRSNTYA